MSHPPEDHDREQGPEPNPEEGPEPQQRPGQGERRAPDEPAHDSRRGLHPVILVICIVVFVFLFFLVREVRTEYVGRYGSEGVGTQESASQEYASHLVSQSAPQEFFPPESGGGVTSGRD